MTLRFGDFYVKLKCLDVYRVLLFLLHIFYEQADISEKWEGERKENCTDKLNLEWNQFTPPHFLPNQLSIPTLEPGSTCTWQRGTRALSISRVLYVALGKWTQTLPARALVFEYGNARQKNFAKLWRIQFMSGSSRSPLHPWSWGRLSKAWAFLTRTEEAHFPRSLHYSEISMETNPA